MYAVFQSYHQEDSYGAGKYLRGQCGDIVDTLSTFRSMFTTSLPEAARKSLDNFLGSTLAGAARNPDTDQRGARGAIVALTALEAELTFILSSQQERIKARSELAFLHLQRMIVVDEDFQRKWHVAFDEGEVRCEKLGSIHLLSHGIFAFKANGDGARTDLMFSEPIDSSITERGVEGLVLTEWKKAENEKVGALRFKEARNQADLYKDGILSGVELMGCRYLIVVSRRKLLPDQIPADDRSKNGVVYRHINIAVEPDTPHSEAKRAAKAD